MFRGICDTHGGFICSGDLFTWHSVFNSLHLGLFKWLDYMELAL